MSSYLLLPRSASDPSSNEEVSGFVQRAKRELSIAKQLRKSRLRWGRTRFTKWSSPSRRWVDEHVGVEAHSHHFWLYPDFLCICNQWMYDYRSYRDDFPNGCAK